MCRTACCPRSPPAHLQGLCVISKDTRRFKETIENLHTLTEAFPLPTKPVCPTLRTIPEDAQGIGNQTGPSAAEHVKQHQSYSTKGQK